MVFGPYNMSYCRCQVWLDDYKQYYYNRIGKDIGDFGNVESRKQLRKNLQCKSFKWYLVTIFPEPFITIAIVIIAIVRYLDTVFPELFIPGEAVAQVGCQAIVNKSCTMLHIIIFVITI